MNDLNIIIFGLDFHIAYVRFGYKLSAVLNLHSSSRNCDMYV